MTTRDPETWPAAHPRQLPRLPGAEAELAGTAVTAIPFLRHDCHVSVACRNLVDALVGKQLQSSQIAPAGAGVTASHPPPPPSPAAPAMTTALETEYPESPSSARRHSPC
jgi:hypothetical protein